MSARWAPASALRRGATCCTPWLPWPGRHHRSRPRSARPRPRRRISCGPSSSARSSSASGPPTATCATPPGVACGPTRIRRRSPVSPDRIETEVDGRRMTLSNLDKVLYPAGGFTKGAVIDYYARIAEVMLPHLKDRPVTFFRFPDGVSGKSFVEKHVPSHAPAWVQTVKVPTSGTGWGRSGEGGRAGKEGGRAGKEGTVEYAVVQDRPTLIWAANLAAIELHVPLWHAGRQRPLPGRPDHMVFD